MSVIPKPTHRTRPDFTMNRPRSRSALFSARLSAPGSALLAAMFTALSAAPSAAMANDFPTVDRVLYVQACMRDNPGNYYEMVNKCSCAVDTLANELTFDDYTTMVTISNGMTLGGERGGAIRDVPTLEPMLKRYKELQAKAKKGCFINDAK